MKKTVLLFILLAFISVFAFRNNPVSTYRSVYNQKLDAFSAQQQKLLNEINRHDLSDSAARRLITAEIAASRRKLKAIDFWLRYLDPTIYRSINGPLPVEWETEVFEKYEQPHKREGAGLINAENYLHSEDVKKDSLLSLIRLAIKAEDTFRADSTTVNLNSHNSFFLCNRLFLLNLAAVYTTGFECPDTDRVIPELQNMLQDVTEIYTAYNETFTAFPLTENYLSLYSKAISFVQNQPKDFTSFDHFTLIKDYINPLFALNQQLIVQYQVYTKSYVDFTLNNSTSSIFDKSLFFAQSTKGIYRRINDPQVLAEIDSIGKLLFYDPVLSGNNQRSCVSCHKSTAFFTDTAVSTSLQFNGKDALTRNTPTLLNTIYNHLLHLDGKILTLQEQAHTVITNPIELGSKEDEVLKKIMSCNTYKKAFKKYLKYTPEEPELTFEHIASAITLYYGKFSRYYSPFDEAFNSGHQLSSDVISGFNLYMSKAQCATCHFLPTFSGIKPPYVENEFEVIGTPADVNYKALSTDKGRYEKNPAPETMHAFRTSTLRNAANTKPYMHNGIFNTLEEVIDFYDGGGGAGHKLIVPNQTLAADSLQLTATEKKQLLAFLKSLNETVIFENPPATLPVSSNKELNKRKVGGEY